ncbi:uncharacterized protein LOC128209990 [Mya arenaria]|uniref:uncharacterized protein LOC128209990 n=1 Tax=Mya arenaria TaxID=6604 RepID=UPI0022E32251|nr:uncharacterized protein LOC128209990 [Mya arenaria]XP_052770235.1 uncharacterized protein LOC128209990 [Mya arenaria]
MSGRDWEQDDVRLNNYNGEYEPRMLQHSVNNLRLILERQTSVTWQRISQKTGLYDNRAQDVWGRHSTYFSESDLPKHREAGEQYGQQVDGNYESGDVGGEDFRPTAAGQRATASPPDDHSLKTASDSGAGELFVLDYKGTSDKASTSSTTSDSKADKEKKIEHIHAGYHDNGHENSSKKPEDLEDSATTQSESAKDVGDSANTKETLNPDSNTTITSVDSECMIVGVTDGQEVYTVSDEDNVDEDLVIVEGVEGTEVEEGELVEDKPQHDDVVVSIDIEKSNEDEPGSNVKNVEVNRCYKCDLCDFQQADRQLMEKHLQECGHYRATAYMATLSGELVSSWTPPLSFKVGRPFTSKLVVCVSCRANFKTIHECGMHYSLSHDSTHTQHKYGLSEVMQETLCTFPESCVCEVCGKVNHSHKEYMQHCLVSHHLPFTKVKKDHSTLFVCLHHDLLCQSFQDICHHLEQKHRKKGIKQYLVIQYSKSFETKDLLFSPLQRGQGLVKDSAMSKKHKLINTSYQELFTNTGTSRKSVFYKCDYCSVENEEEIAMRDHFKSAEHASASELSRSNSGEVVINTPSVIKYPPALFINTAIVCPAPDCYDVFINPFQCTEHYYKVHTGNEMGYGLATVEADTWFTYPIAKRYQECPVCKTSFKKLYQLDSHFKSTGHSYFSPRENCVTMLYCKYCCRCLSSFKNIVNHLKQAHGQQLWDQVNIRVFFLRKMKETVPMPPFSSDILGERNAVLSEIREMKKLKKEMGKSAKKKMSQKIREMRKMLK